MEWDNSQVPSVCSSKIVCFEMMPRIGRDLLFVMLIFIFNKKKMFSGSTPDFFFSDAPVKLTFSKRQ